MEASGNPRVTELLLAWGQGDEAAMDRLAPLVYQELHRLARGYMKREREAHTLQTSALVNEAYLRLIDVQQVRWQNRSHFFAMASRMMRRILVDFARRRRYQKRGGGAERAAELGARCLRRRHAGQRHRLHGRRLRAVGVGGDLKGPELGRGAEASRARQLMSSALTLLDRSRRS